MGLGRGLDRRPLPGGELHRPGPLAPPAHALMLALHHLVPLPISQLPFLAAGNGWSPLTGVAAHVAWSILTVFLGRMHIGVSLLAAMPPAIAAMGSEMPMLVG